ncbi:putative transcriptional regulator of N-Acetylglucosamine utilization, GntR family protein [Streptomyces sp. PVA_94-07]|nr:putative transcriptional regulator of N-Acetylglucosamine utilization, GntR family protein [Streptomyces sp. PVA_94-07]
MARGEPVRHMERVLLADGERVGLESTYVAVARAPALDTGFDPDSSLLRPPPRGAGIAFGDADERIETVLAAPREALLMGTPPALPMLHRLSRDTGGRPMERVRTLFRGDRFSFRTRLGAVPGLTRSVRAPHLPSPSITGGGRTARVHRRRADGRRPAEGDSQPRHPVPGPGRRPGHPPSPCRTPPARSRAPRARRTARSFPTTSSPSAPRRTSRRPTPTPWPSPGC